LQAREWADRLPSERELCERLQVSRPTLRKALTVLAQEGWIRPQRGLGWRVGHAKVRRVSTQRAKSVGILCFVPLDEASGFTLYSIDKLQTHLHNAGLIAQVHAGTQYASQNFKQALERLLRSAPADAWLLVGSPPDIVDWFGNRGLPVFSTLTTRPTTDHPSLSVDMEAVYRHAAGKLVGYGHRRLALVLPRPVSALRHASPESDPAGEAVLSWKQAVAPYVGTPGFAARIVWHTRSRESIQQLLRNLFTAADPPTGLIVLRPQHSLAAVTCLIAAGIHLPQDVSLIGIGYEPFFDHVCPSIAHYALDRKAYVRKLCRLVLPWAKSGFWKPQESGLMMEFHDGESLAEAR
jgi:DNA-binding LacI/PurR family transcriptional regulator